MQYLELSAAQIPLSLLLEGDPSEESIATYLDQAWCFGAVERDIVIGACIVKPLADHKAEIFNVSVLPERQAEGIGTELLKHTLPQLAAREIQRVELGTGAFGYQLIYYQRLGFRVDAVLKDHFLKNYAEPIFEFGVQHKDMLRLYINI